MWVTQSNWKLQTIMTCANTLPGTERKFIPLKLLQSDLDPFLLHSVMIILWCHSSRITSFFQTQAKMWCNALGASLPPRCNIYYMTGTPQISYQWPSDSFSQSVSQLTSQHTTGENQTLVQPNTVTKMVHHSCLGFCTGVQQWSDMYSSPLGVQHGLYSSTDKNEI